MNAIKFLAFGERTSTLLLEYRGVICKVVTGFYNPDGSFSEHQTATGQPAVQASILGTSMGSLIHIDHYHKFLTDMIDGMGEAKLAELLHYQACM